MKVLVFAGAGTSVELGVPAMKGLALEFLAHARQWNVEADLVHRLMDESLDIESLIESLDQIHAARGPLKSLQDSAVPLDRIETVRSEVEWFVQHSAERIAPGDAALMWGSVIRRAVDHEISLVTTNYDRAIELAANAEGVPLEDGFGSFQQTEVVPWLGFDGSGDRPTLVKLHGSTDWYSDVSTGSPLKLRHPMPLFGRGRLHMASGESLGSALVLPSREKLLTRAPYPRLSQAFLNAVDSCDAAVFVGSSLRDPHVRDAAATMVGKKPVFVVGPSGGGSGVDGVQAISQTASQFLVSTLPMALAQVDPGQVLAQIAAAPQPSPVETLVLLRVAIDKAEPAQRRCDAIEKLDGQSVCLDRELLHGLLSDDEEAVARYALGLIPLSPDRSVLLAEAMESNHAQGATFADELALLKKVIDSEATGRGARLPPASAPDS